jgi:hypothetical protein
MADIEDIKKRVAYKYDECEFVEICGITIHELMEAFPEKMMESVEELGVEDQDDEEDN